MRPKMIYFSDFCKKVGINISYWDYNHDIIQNCAKSYLNILKVYLESIYD